MLGCTSPTAKNYDPTATEDDGSCIWLDNIEGTCYEFTEVPADSVIDNSFTVSMAIEQETMKPEGWVYFHDYLPDAYVHVRNTTPKLINFKTNIGFYQSLGQKGIYHFNTDPKPFFIDIIFAGTPALNQARSALYSQAYKPYPAMILDSINWVSEVRDTGNNVFDDNQRALFLQTITHITIWNEYQTSGRIALTQNTAGLTQANSRNSEETWHFNNFRDILDSPNQFVQSIFQDYRIDSSKLNPNLAWWKKRLIQGKYFIVRFEFDNNNNKQIMLHDMDADISKSVR